MAHEYILVLGSNLGDRDAYLHNARAFLEAKGVNVVARSAILETDPILVQKQPKFLNQGLRIETAFDPLELLDLVKEAEAELGRSKRQRYGAREIDIDIVWWSGGRFDHSQLIIPHPFNNARYWVRQFVSQLGSAASEAMALAPIKGPQDFRARKAAGEKISMLTCYDYSMASLMARTSIDAVMIGDSMGNVIQGHDSTLPVTLDDIIYHTRCVRRGLPDAFIVSDLPFMTYQVSVEQAVTSAGRLIKESGCDAVKLEGALSEHVSQIVKAGIPVMGHLGLTPQSVRAMGGYRVQAKEQAEKEKLLQDAIALEDAGAFAIVLEVVPGDIGTRVSEKLSIPTIGIGAGVGTDGQVLVLQDMLGMNPDFKPRFVRNYGQLAEKITEAVEAYAQDVRKKEFPSAGETFN